MTERRRRIDIVQSSDFTRDLGSVDVAELRSRRRMCNDLDVEFSYYRRLLHGRMDLLAFELRRRRGDDERSLVDALPEILAGEVRSGPGIPERHVDVEVPSLPDVGRRAVDKVLSEDFLARLSSIDEDEIAEIQQRLSEVEAEISRHRRAVHKAYDRIQSELTRRYREGSADADELLRQD